jgi:hypothetical protein
VFPQNGITGNFNLSDPNLPTARSDMHHSMYVPTMCCPYILIRGPITRIASRFIHTAPSP